MTRYRVDKPIRIFSGNYSADMWETINEAKSINELREALYVVCCRIQELEALIDLQEKSQPINGLRKKAKRK